VKKHLRGLLSSGTKLSMLAACLFVATSVAKAQIIQVTFSGTVTSTTGTIDPSVVAGTAFQYVVLYDLSTLPWQTDGTVVADYHVLSMTTTVGDYTLTNIGNENIQITSELPQGFPIPDFYLWGYSMEQYTGDLSAYSSVTLFTETHPEVAPDTSLGSIQEFPVSDFGHTNAFFVGFDSGNDHIDGVVTGYTVQAVPEPTTGVLVLAGAGLWLLRRRASVSQA
jgi:hypothetical protein